MKTSALLLLLVALATQGVAQLHLEPDTVLLRIQEGGFYVINETSSPVSIDSIKLGPISSSAMTLVLTMDTTQSALSMGNGWIWQEFLFYQDFELPETPPPDSLVIPARDTMEVSWFDFTLCGVCKPNINQTSDFIDSLMFYSGTNIYTLYYDYSLYLASEEDPFSPGSHHFSIVRSYPNPFNPVTQLEYRVRQATDLSLRVFSQDGRVILSKKLGVRNAGTHSTSLDLRAFASGVYIVELFSAGFVDRQTITLVK